VGADRPRRGFDRQPFAFARCRAMEMAQSSKETLELAASPICLSAIVSSEYENNVAVVARLDWRAVLCRCDARPFRLALSRGAPAGYHDRRSARCCSSTRRKLGTRRPMLVERLRKPPPRFLWPPASRQRYGQDSPPPSEGANQALVLLLVPAQPPKSKQTVNQRLVPPLECPS
jgi:hypothetical protein